MEVEFVTAVEMVGNDRSRAEVLRAALRKKKFPLASARGLLGGPQR
jgi:hypothetical protein